MKKLIIVLLLIGVCIGIAACQPNNSGSIITLGSRTVESLETETVESKTTSKETDVISSDTNVDTNTETTKSNVTTATDPVVTTETSQKTTTTESDESQSVTTSPNVTTEETTREDPFINYTELDCALTFYADAVMGKRIEDPNTFILINAYYDTKNKAFVEDEVNSFEFWNETLKDDAKRSVLFENAPLLNINDKLVIQYDEATPGLARQESGTAIISSIKAYVYEDYNVVEDNLYISNGDGIEECDFSKYTGDSSLKDLYVIVKITQFGDLYRVSGEYKQEYIDYYAIIHVHVNG